VGAYGRFLVRFARVLKEADRKHYSAADFSVEVSDPDPKCEGARDAGEWKQYFEKYGEVAAVSVVLDNADLLERLAKRRWLARKVRDRLAGSLTAL
jgi:hypothetical protein